MSVDSIDDLLAHAVEISERQAGAIRRPFTVMSVMRRVMLRLSTCSPRESPDCHAWSQQDAGEGPPSTEQQAPSRDIGTVERIVGSALSPSPMIVL